MGKWGEMGEMGENGGKWGIVRNCQKLHIGNCTKSVQN